MPDRSEVVSHTAVDSGSNGVHEPRTRSSRSTSARRKNGRTTRAIWIVLLPTMLLSVWAAAWVIHGTHPYTSEFQGDSQVYLSTAQNIRSHGLPAAGFNLAWDGFTPNEALAFHGRVPSSVFPPGYPAALALTSFVTGGVHNAARVLDVVLIVVNLLLIGLLTARMTRNRSIVVATAPAVLLLFDTDIRRIFFAPLFGWMQLHRSVSSEPLFMASSVVGLLALHAALSASGTRRGRRALMIAIVASAIALLVRYVDVAFILSSAIALLALDHGRAVRSRIRRAVIFTVAAGLPTALFALWALLDGGGLPTSKIYTLQGGVLAPIDRLADYVLPSGGPHALRLLAVFVMLGFVLYAAVWGPDLPGGKPGDDREARLLLQLTALFLAVYVLFVMAVVAFFDLAVPIDARIFAPIRGLWYAVVFAMAYRLLVHVWSSVVAVAIVGAAVAVLVVTNWSNTRPILAQGPTLPYARTAVATAIDRIPAAALIVSNNPDAVYSLNGRDAIDLPFVAGPPTPKYEREMSQVIQLLETRGGYLALNWFPNNPYSVPPELQALDLHLVAQAPNNRPSAALYEVAPSPREQK